MPLVSGDKLGPYEIVAAIGEGGMGEVYRARDPRLSRDVAIKVSAERYNERFEREARTIAALNHPHICQIYDVGALPTGAGYIVMELVEGENLKGPLPLETAVKYAGQIAEALEAAHEKGIVHRDLKPANIKITPAGSVKVLDFGLAKVAPASAVVSENSPTLSMGMTQAGVILGTAAYMSPEQARGEPVDKRADIWAFGVVFFEMLAGQRMYQGKTVSDVLAAVLVTEPDLTKVPPRVRKLLRRCLVKDPKNRLRDIADAMPLLEEEPEPTAPSQSRLGTGGRVGMAGWIAAGAMTIIAGVALWGWLKPVTPAPKPVTQFSLTLPSGVGAGNAPVLSRDGSLLAIATGEPSKPLYLRRMDQLEARPLPGTEGAAGVAFSPDGQWIAYMTSGNRSLKKVPVAGGAALTLEESAGGISDLDWGLDDNIYYTSTTELLRAPSNGGKPQVLLTADPTKEELQYGEPQLLPGGKVVLFGVLGPRGLNLARILALNLQTGEKKTVVEGSLRAHYAAAGATPDSGYIVYGLNGALLAAPLEMKGLKVGPPRPVLEGVGGFGPIAQFGFSDSGTLAYMPGTVGDPNSLGSATVLWVDRQGKEQVTPAPPRIYDPLSLQLSPDNQRVAQAALDLQRLTADVWVYDLGRGNQPRITFEGSNVNPLWTPDGKRLIYWFSRDVTGQQNPEIRSVPADSSAPPTTLFTSEAPPYIPFSVSPDGKLLMGIRNKAGGPGPVPTAGNQIWVLPLDTPNAKPRAFLESQFAKFNPQFSPDGKSVAYQANDSGRDEVYVVPFPGPGGKQQVSTDGGTAPRWSHDGRELFYRNGNKMMAVDVQTGAAFHVTGTPKMLFEKPGGYDVSRDGKRFLMMRPGAPAGGSNQINVVLNWFEELRRRAGASASK